MKTHAKQFPTFWTGATARQLATTGPFPRLLANYFFTSPAAVQSDNYGLYYIERHVIRHHVGIDDATLDQVVELLARLTFAFWDADTEWVWVREMAAWQYRTPLLPRDYNCANARRFYKSLPKNPWLGYWFDRYVSDLCLQQTDDEWVERREWTGLSPSIAGYVPTVAAPGPRPRPQLPPPSKPSKPKPEVVPFVDRLHRRLASLRMNGEIGTAITRAIRQLEQGDVELVAIERRLLDVVIEELGDQVKDQAREQVVGFQKRMSQSEYQETYQRALDAAARRMTNLPVFEE